MESAEAGLGGEAGRIRLRWEEGFTPGLLLGEQEKGPAYGWNIVSFDLDSGDEDEDTDGDGENGKVCAREHNRGSSSGRREVDGSDPSNRTLPVYPVLAVYYCYLCDYC